MNRVNEYFQNLDKKNMIMLYMSVVILFIIIGYLLQDSYFGPMIDNLNNKQENLYKKLSKTKKNKLLLLKLKKEEIKKKTLLASLKEDEIYLNSVIETSDVLNVDKNKYLLILREYLKKGSLLNASFELNETKLLEKYKIHINGYFLPNRFYEFVDFLKTIQKPNAVITINSVDIYKFKDKIKYDLNVSIWSLK